MPFTPFHFGPGAALKAAIPSHFSFSVFCFAQVLIDVEVLVYMVRGGERLHGWAHTYIGAVVVAVASVLIGRPVCQGMLSWWFVQPNLPLKEYFNPSPKITWVGAAIGAVLGSFSHVFLDSLMHGDVQPLLPLSEMSHPCGKVDGGVLHLLCFVLAVIGAFVCARYRRARL